jgi:hypothetical protein
MVAQGVGSEFKPQYRKKKKKDEIGICVMVSYTFCPPNIMWKSNPYYEISSSWDEVEPLRGD